MTTSTTIALAFLVLLALVTLGFWLYRRGQSTGAAEEVRDNARADEARAVTEVKHEEAVAVQAADEQLVHELARDPVERGNEIADAERKRRAGLLCVAGILLASSPARAECVHVADGVHCDLDTYTLIIDANAHLEHDLADQIAGTEACTKERDAAKVHVAALEAAPVPPGPSPLGYVLAGAVGAAVVLGVLLIVH
jgi:hypothetical protein